MVAPDHAAARSKLAKASGLGRVHKRAATPAKKSRKTKGSFSLIAIDF
ncbi:hypothetical protein V5F48_23795 [Xanthobacter autotrophicus ATCC 700552]